MDNEIVSVARLLLGILEGKELHVAGHQCLLDYFSAYASPVLPPLNSAAFEVLMDQYRQADAFLALGKKWHSRLAVADPDQREANAFIKDFVQSLSHLYRLDVDGGLVCGSTVTEAHSVMDYVTDHPPRGHHWILHWTTEGRCLFLDQLQRQVGRGELVLIPPDLACRYQRSPACERWVHHWLRFVPDPAWLQWCPPLHRRRGLLVAALAEDHCLSVDSAFIDLERLQRTADSPLALNRLEFLLILLADAGAADHVQMDPRIQTALTFIADKFAEDWTLSELALHCHMSVPRLAGLFRQQLGVAPMQWRDQLRMQEACKLLREMRSQVAEVGRAVGYDDPLHFSRRFKQLVGSSPRDYRRRQ